MFSLKFVSINDLKLKFIVVNYSVYSFEYYSTLLYFYIISYYTQYNVNNNNNNTTYHAYPSISHWPYLIHFNILNIKLQYLPCFIMFISLA